MNPAARKVRVEWTEPTGICGYCNGSGEGRFDGTTCTHCHGGGEASQPVELDLVECPCGWSCAGAEWVGKDDGLCPKCGLDLETEIEAQRPDEARCSWDEAQEPDDEP